MPVDIICATFNGARFLGAFLDSVRHQSHAEWRLWLRDDGSTDDTVSIARSCAAADHRVVVLSDPVGRRGIVAGFGWLLEQLPADATHVMFADQDDVWLSPKIVQTLDAMHRAERDAPGPVLVHTDAVVVDADLTEIAPSFWVFAHTNPALPSLRDAVTRPVVTGATAMLNRPLLQRIGAIPAGAAMHDWWAACVAAVFGRVVPLHTPTMLYRQHGANSIGARRSVVSLAWYELAGRTVKAMQQPPTVRRDVTRAAQQAQCLLDRYPDELSADDRRFLLDYARIPALPWLQRKAAVARLHLSPSHTALQKLGLVLRA